LYIDNRVRDPEISFALNINGEPQTVLTLGVDQGKFHVEIPEGVEATEAAKNFLTVLTEIYPAWQTERQPKVKTTDFHDPWYVGNDSGMPASAFFLDAEDTVKVIHQPVKISDLPSLPKGNELFYVHYNPNTDTLSKVPTKSREVDFAPEEISDPEQSPIWFNSTLFDTTNFQASDRGAQQTKMLEDAVKVYALHRPATLEQQADIEYFTNIDIKLEYGNAIFGKESVRLPSMDEDGGELFSDGAKIGTWEKITPDFELEIQPITPVVRSVEKPVMTSGHYMRPESAKRLDSIMSRYEAANPKPEVTMTSGTYEKE